MSEDPLKLNSAPGACTIDPDQLFATAGVQGFSRTSRMIDAGEIRMGSTQSYVDREREAERERLEAGLVGGGEVDRTELKANAAEISHELSRILNRHQKNIRSLNSTHSEYLSQGMVPRHKGAGATSTLETLELELDSAKDSSARSSGRRGSVPASPAPSVYSTGRASAMSQHSPGKDRARLFPRPASSAAGREGGAESSPGIPRPQSGRPISGRPRSGRPLSGKTSILGERRGGRNDLLEETRADARDKYNRHLVAERERHNNMEQTKALELKIAEMEADLFRVEAAKLQLERDATTARRETQVVRQESQSLRDSLTLLRKKSTTQQRRLHAAEQQLRGFQDMLPVFDELRAIFHFAKPEDIVTRIKTLEQHQVDAFSRAADAEESKGLAVKELEEFKSGVAKAQSAVREDLQRSLSKALANNEDLLEEIQILKQGRDQLNVMRTKYLDLSMGVMDLWTQWEANSELLDADAPVNTFRPDLGDPLQVLRACDLLFTCHTATPAGRYLRELGGIANALWGRFLASETNLRCSPKAVMVALRTQLEDSATKAETLTKEVAALRTKLRDSEDRAETADRHVRRMQALMDKRKSIYRMNVSRRPARPASAMPSSGRVPASTRPATASRPHAHTPSDNTFLTSGTGMSLSQSPTAALSARTKRAGSARVRPQSGRPSSGRVGKGGTGTGGLVENSPVKR
ncbi:hypothetical protein KIPB_008492 [Kipferlia bialata]|uniref:Uncharacterized protein n=1 Tax=Kipferlia bialata TaxID=797122 RepID=A0A9K3GJW9_9EUKA|nr:hypothetical protein KIPB_008492 [Kipferlia bialata]|eukprot:g8492.t1